MLVPRGHTDTIEKILFEQIESVLEELASISQKVNFADVLARLDLSQLKGKSNRKYQLEVIYKLCLLKKLKNIKSYPKLKRYLIENPDQGIMLGLEVKA